MKSAIQMMGSFFITWFTYLFGGMDVALITLLIAIGLDCVTGLIKAYVLEKLSSKAGIRGCVKKIGFLCLVAVAVIVDQLCNSNGVIRSFVIYYFVVNECLSILENCAALNLPVPKFLIEKLEQLKGKGDTEKLEK